MAIDFEIERKYVDIDGSRMSYLDIGSGDVIVLGHSYLWSAEMWIPQIHALSRRYRVIVPELWGHGQSAAMPTGTSDLQQVAQHHLALLDALDVKTFAIVGLSVGGMWGAELALSHPERVTALALLGTYMGSEKVETRARYFSMLDTVAALAAVPDQIVEGLLPLFFSPSSFRDRQGLVEGFRTRLRQTDRQLLVNTIIPLGRMIFARRDGLDDLRRLDKPTLVMTGEHDLSRPPEEGRLMAQILNCEFVELPGAGHISSLEIPDLVTRNLLSFLAAALVAAGQQDSPRARSI